MFLLDTCTLLWLVAGDKSLSKLSKEKIFKNKKSLYVSSVSALEIALKHKRNKLKLPLPPSDWFSQVLEFHGINEVKIDSQICAYSADLPDIHNDPFDRIIISTAVINNFKILTPDKFIKKYEEADCVW